MGKAIRTATCVLLLAVGALAVAGSLVASWVDRTLLNTDTFVTAVEPLVRDEALLTSASTRISAAIVAKVDLKALADSSAVPQALKPIVRSAAADFDSFVSTQITSAVHSDTFIQLTLSSLREWHERFRSAVTTLSPDAQNNAGTVRITLGPYLDVLAEQADDSIVAYAISVVPEDVRSAQVAVLDLAPITQSLPALRALHRSGPYLPWAALAALLGGVLVAPRRSFAAAGAGLATAAVSGGTLALLGSALHGQAATLAEKIGASTTVAEPVVSTLMMPLANTLVWAVVAGAVVGVVGIGIAIWERSRRADDWDDVGFEDLDDADDTLGGEE